MFILRAWVDAEHIMLGFSIGNKQAFVSSHGTIMRDTSQMAPQNAFTVESPINVYGFDIKMYILVAKAVKNFKAM